MEKALDCTLGRSTHSITLVGHLAMTLDKGLSPANHDMDTDLKKTTSAWAMWTSSDLITSASSAASDVLDNAGCRLPLSSPALDSCPSVTYKYCDQELVDAVDTGERLFPDHDTLGANLRPGAPKEPGDFVRRVGIDGSCCIQPDGPPGQEVNEAPAIHVVNTPEPTSLSLLACGAILLGRNKSRRLKAAS